MAELVTIVLASSNEGKLAELRSLLAELPVQLVTLKDLLGQHPTLPEDGNTFEANAVQKARAAHQLTGLPALADDSGLEVTGLQGRPGVRSARFSHERATDAENNAALLRELESVDDEGRVARFRCVLALVVPGVEQPLTVEGTASGSIARDSRGGGGFGYDPLFLVDGFEGRAMAELSDTEKNQVSHRGQAARAMKPLIAQLLSNQLDEAERIAG